VSVPQPPMVSLLFAAPVLMVVVSFGIMAFPLALLLNYYLIIPLYFINIDVVNMYVT
jgi:hypothetical protein